ncbi:MAG: tRNA 2-thiouridine(34) synthase MnmA [Spirochaetaceae bacterium]|nr:tRNA 2-thiouridine(34) synthase MnmA [Spirochaetaceae bacterium]
MKVLVGISGGIDSAVSAYLLKQKGYEVSAVTMLLGNNESSKIANPMGTNYCFAPNKDEDLRKVKEICKKLDIPHTVVDISSTFEETVLSDFKKEYLNGRTPNPCVWCNVKVKFGAMVDAARAAGLDFDKFATGHYARILEENGRFFIKRAKDQIKDQSYFLYRVTQEQLSNTIFYLGDYEKTEIRAIDVEQGFHKEEQTESQDFYGGDYTDLLGVEAIPGDIVTRDGKVLGKHNGLFHYTIGQRKGLGIAAPQPLYVIELDTVRNEVIVGNKEDTFHSEVEATQVVWSKVETLEDGMYEVKIRSTGLPIQALVSSYKNEAGEDVLKAIFNPPIQAASEGQSLVIYQDDCIMAGGIINKTKI